MPSQHKNPKITYRPDPELYRRAQAAAARQGTSLTAQLTAFLAWLAGDTDHLPARPAPHPDAGHPDHGEPADQAPPPGTHA